MKRKTMKLGVRILRLLRAASSGAQSNYNMGGSRKPQHKAPKRITLAGSDFKRRDDK